MAAARADDDTVRLTTLDNGIRVVTEHMDSVRSVATGVWVGVGARDEPEALSGASHFLEHLLFKGTATRSAQDIAESVDAVGGEMNAFTTKEYTAYYTRLPAAELAFGIELLGDVVAAPAFRPEEVDTERHVILEEILMNEDAPDDRVHTLVFEARYPDHPLGREVLGDAGTIEAMARDDIADFHARHYRPENLVVAAAGLLDHDDVVARVDAALSTLPAGVPPERTAPSSTPRPLAVLRRPTEQVHLALAWPGLSQDDPDRYALSVANHVLGGGTASRLFQEVREKRGLAYGVYSSPSSYADTGLVLAYVGTAPMRMGEAVDVVAEVVDGLVGGGVTDTELAVARGYLEGSLVLGLEDSSSRMGRIGSNVCTRGKVIPIEEHLDRIRAVTHDDVARVLGRVFGGERTLAAVGPVDDRDFPV
ncbi:MAG: insulinase family protein [Microthrixaceae bacterium]|nr:insulinase family protein [Microthrixaceae bacterium]